MKLIIFVGLIAMAMADGDVGALLKEGNDKFTARMFTQVVNKNPDKSVILSAFSVLSPLAQLGLASVGESHDEILKAIGLPNDNVTTEAFQSLNNELREVKGVVLKMANRIYIAQDAQLNANFAEVSRNVFNSDVKNIDFSKNTQAAGEVNAWVEEQTNSKIKDLVDPGLIDGSTRAVLVNAIYFKGSWEDPFNKTATRDADFHVTKEKTVKVPTMHKTATYRYGESSELDAQLLEIPYEGHQTSFVIVLPNKIDDIKNLQVKLQDPTFLNKAMDEMYPTEVIIAIPKFKIETTTNLKEVLQNMDINRLFDAGKARLDNLLSKESNLYISDAIQKAFIEVNEEGAEAAAANAFVGFGSSFNPSKPKPKLFIVDKPFYFQILNIRLPIFEGVYKQP